MKHLSAALGIDFETEQSSNLPTLANDGDEREPVYGDETNYSEIDDIIIKTHAHGMSLLESADTYELAKQPRIYEVAGQLLNASLAAIKVKHAYEKNSKDHELKKTNASQGGQGNSGGNTQINNFFGDRESLMKHMEEMMLSQTKQIEANK